MQHSQSKAEANREKKWVALTSVLAAIFLTGMKLIVGILTGSLGILSEAAHSGLDFVAAAMTYFAVRLSSRPADERYTYGYGKIENLSALGETALLLLTCVWVVYEAIQRLFFRDVEVEVTIWSFIVMVVSIGVDVGRSRALAKAAEKHRSQALEADALHFSTDIWSSLVVIGGLFLVYLAEWLDLPWLIKADAVAAIGVAGIVVYVSLQLGRKTLEALLDAVPPGLYDEVLGAIRVPGVLEIQRVRIRRSGPETFVDLILTVGPETNYEQADLIAREVKQAVLKILPEADVLVYTVSERMLDGSKITKTIRRQATRYGLGVHSIRIYDNGPEGYNLELHIEVNETLRLEDAHKLASNFEISLKETLLTFNQIITHIEPAGDASATRIATSVDESMVTSEIEKLAEELGVLCRPHDVVVHQVGQELTVSFHCYLRGDAPVMDVHAVTEQFERELRTRIPQLGRVVIHTEPFELAEGDAQ